MADAEQLAKALVVGFLTQEDHKLAEKAEKKLGAVSSDGVQRTKRGRAGGDLL